MQLCRPAWALASSFLVFLDHTQQRTTIGDQLVAETSTWQHPTLTTEKTIHTLVGFEPTISSGEGPQTYALDRAVTGTGLLFVLTEIFYYFLNRPT